MIKNLKVKNFRKLTDHSFHFTGGLNVIRGSNEAGKSTTLSAISYALFGLKVMPDPLDQIVTWGQPDKSLKVELTFTHDGTEYTATRSKSGAEINYPGGKVTGQTETKEFVERLFSVDATCVSRLMLSTQGAIRGALEQGPKATMELIEQLADFDLIDKVIELIGDRLTTGHAGPLEEKIQALTERAEQLQAGLKEPDVATFEVQKAEVAGQVSTMQAELVSTWQPAHDAAQAAVNDAQAAKQLRYSLAQNLEKSQATMARSIQDKRQAEIDAATAPAATDMEAAELAVDQANWGAELDAAHARVQKLIAVYPEAYWDEPRETLDVEIAGFTYEVDSAKQTIAGLEGEIRALAREPAKGTKCGACGQELPDAEAIAKHQAEVMAQLQTARDKLAVARAGLQEGEETLHGLRSVLQSSLLYDNAAIELKEFVEVDGSCVPPKLTWKGPQTWLSGDDIQALKQRVLTLKQLAKRAQEAAARVVALEGNIVLQADQIKDIEQRIAQLGTADELPALREKLAEVDSQYMLRVNGISEYKAQLSNLERAHAVAMATYSEQFKQAGDADVAVAVAKKELEILLFNNLLLKTVRAARPIIADKLWSVVLLAVSSYFSSMRGTTSVVTRESNGFKVDGHMVGGGSLSGSTLDILGLAIRMALTRTFLPTAPFLIMDEPAAAMDEERTRSMLAFLVAAGFPQTILVTHEDTSAEICDNLITI